MPPPVYRYDEQDYAPGQVIQSRGDYIHGLTAQQRAAEEAIRKVSAEWERTWMIRVILFSLNLLRLQPLPAFER